MSISYPVSLDSFVNPAANSDYAVISHALQHSNANDAIVALQNKVGIDGSAVTTSIDWLLKNSYSVNPGHKHTLGGGGLSDLVITSPGAHQFLAYDTGSACWINRVIALGDLPTEIPNSNLANSTINVVGTTNRVSVSGSPVALGGTVTLSGPQDLHTAATPTFATVYATDISDIGSGNLAIYAGSGSPNKAVFRYGDGTGWDVRFTRADGTIPTFAVQDTGKAIIGRETSGNLLAYWKSAALTLVDSTKAAKLWMVSTQVNSNGFSIASKNGSAHGLVIRDEDSGTDVLVINNSASVGIQDLNASLGRASGDFEIRSWGGYNLLLRASNFLSLSGGSTNEGLRVVSSGRVLVGTTTDDGVRTLQIGGSLLIGTLNGVLKASSGVVAGSATTSDLTEGSNLYYTNARGISSTLTGYTSGAGTISSADSILSAIQKLNGNVGALVTGVSSVFGRTGIVVATSGDYTTAQVTEVTNLYYTDARARAALSATSPVTYNSSTGVIAISQSTISTNGYLSSTDWNTFNGKEGAISAGTTAQYWRGDKTWQTLNKAAVAGLTNSDSPTFANLFITTYAEFNNSKTSGTNFYAYTSVGSLRVSDDGGSSYLYSQIRADAGKNAFLTFTENIVADRWIIGIKNGDASLYFATGNPSSNTTVATLSSSAFGIRNGNALKLYSSGDASSATILFDGAFKFNNDVLPSADGSYNLGSTSKMWYRVISYQVALGGDSAAYIYRSSNDLWLQTYSGYNIQLRAAGYTALFSGGNEVARATSGQLLVGMTSGDGSSPFQVTGNTKHTGGLNWFYQTGGAWRLLVYPDSTAYVMIARGSTNQDILRVRDTSDSTTVGVIDYQGNISFQSITGTSGHWTGQHTYKDASNNSRIIIIPDSTYGYLTAYVPSSTSNKAWASFDPTGSTLLSYVDGNGKGYFANVTVSSFTSGFVKSNGSGVLSSNSLSTLSDFGITDAVQNATGTPSIYAAATGSRPAGATGQLFVDTTLQIIQRYNGSSWVTILPALTGDVTTSIGSAATTIANNAVTTAKINDGSVTSAKLSTGVRRVVLKFMDGSGTPGATGPAGAIQDVPYGIGNASLTWTVKRAVFHIENPNGNTSTIQIKYSAGGNVAFSGSNLLGSSLSLSGSSSYEVVQTSSFTTTLTSGQRLQVDISALGASMTGWTVYVELEA